MPDTQFIAVILLLVAAVVFGYFYLKRAQARNKTISADVELRTPKAPPPDYASPAAASTDDLTMRRNGGPTEN